MRVGCANFEKGSGMTWRAGRFARVHFALGTLLCAALGAAALLRQVPVGKPESEAIVDVTLKKTPCTFANLDLKEFDLVDSNIDLRADFHASAFIIRPGAMVPKRALCLRDLERQTERDVTEGQPIYLKQERGNLAFARLGETTPLWALPKRVGDAVSLDIYAHIKGEDHLIKQITIPFDDAKPWPSRGIEVAGLCIDRSLFQNLGVKWYGRNRLDPNRGEPLYFETTGRVCYAKQGDWFSLSSMGFGPIEARKTKYEPVIQLKEVSEEGLEFEVVDADAQCALRLRLTPTQDPICDAPLQLLNFHGRRQAHSAHLECGGKVLNAPFGSLIFFSDGVWSGEEKLGPALRIEGIEKGKLIATLFSPGRSQTKKLRLSAEGM